MRNLQQTVTGNPAYRLFVVVCALLMSTFLVVLPYAAQAMSDEQRALYSSGTRFFEIGECNPNGRSTARLSTGHQPSKLYIVGDSIMAGAYYNPGPLKEILQKKGWSAEVDAKGGRGMEYSGGGALNGELPGRGKPGIEAIKADADAVSDADTIVIALGTNESNKDLSGEKSAAIFKSQAEDAIKAVRKNNQNAPIYWVKIFAEPTTGAPYPKQYNQVINSLAAEQKNVYTIDLSDAKIPMGDALHPSSPEGYKVYSKALVDKLAGGEGESVAAESSSAKDVSKLSAEEKIARTFLVGFDVSSTPKSTIEDVVKKYKLGGIYILGNGAEAAGFDKTFFDKLNKSAGYPLVIASDEEGVITRYSYGFNFPSAGEMGKMTNTRVEDIGQKVGEAMARRGINTDLAPVLDVATNSSNTVATTPARAFSDNATTVTQKARAFANGLQAAGINPVYKHFPGLGSTDGNSDQQSVTSPPLSELKKKDLKPYEKLANENGAAVMMNNARIPGLTKGSDVASTSSEAVDLLRKDYEFDGLIMTDDLNAKAVGGSTPNAVAKALEAGVNMPLFTYTGTANIDAAIDAVKRADISINKSLSKISDFVSGANANSAKARTASAGDCTCGQESGTLSVTGRDQQEKVFNFFVQIMNYSAEQAAGATGSLMFESKLDPTIVNPNSGAYGLAQWLDTRLANLKASAGENYNTLEGQLKYLKEELDGTAPGMLYLKPVNEKMKNTTTYIEAQELWTKEFEGLRDHPDQWHFPERNNYANDTLTKFGSGGSGGGGSIGPDGISCSKAEDGSGEVTGEFAFPLDKKYYNQNPEWFTKPHHDHPSADIPVGAGVPAYALMAGKVVLAPVGGSCGNGIFVDAGNGIQYGYCHGTDGGSVSGAKVGDTVNAGQVIMHVDNTDFGNPRTSTGTHLHVQIKVNGQLRCPQKLFVSIIEGNPMKVEDLPSSGCTN